jgi:hypothetical protein
MRWNSTGDIEIIVIHRVKIEVHLNDRYKSDAGNDDRYETPLLCHGADLYTLAAFLLIVDVDIDDD